MSHLIVMNMVVILVVLLVLDYAKILSSFNVKFVQIFLELFVVLNKIPYYYSHINE